MNWAKGRHLTRLSHPGAPKVMFYNRNFCISFRRLGRLLRTFIMKHYFCHSLRPLHFFSISYHFPTYMVKWNINKHNIWYFRYLIDPQNKLRNIRQLMQWEWLHTKKPKYYHGGYHSELKCTILGGENKFTLLEQGNYKEMLRNLPLIQGIKSLDKCFSNVIWGLQLRNLHFI